VLHCFTGVQNTKQVDVGSASAISWFESIVSELTCYVSSGTLSSTDYNYADVDV